MNNIVIVLFALMLFALAQSTWKVRYYLLLILTFLSLAHLPIYITETMENSIRLPLILLLMISGTKEITLYIKKPTNFKAVTYMTIIILYISIYIYSSKYDHSYYFKNIIGQYMCYILYVIYLPHLNKQETKIFFAIVGFAMLPILLSNTPSARIILAYLGFPTRGVLHQLAGQHAVILVPLVLLGIRSSCKTYIRVFLWAVLIFVLYLVIMSGARSSLGFILLTLFLWWRKISYTIIICVIVVVLYSTFVMNSDSSEIESRYTQLVSVYTTKSADEVYNIEFRLEHLQKGFELFLRSPILGNGFRSWFDLYRDDIGMSGYNLAPHNEFVRILVEYGFLGMFLLFMFLKSSTQYLRKRPADTNEFWGAAEYAVFLAIIMHVAVNFFHNSLLTRKFFILTAIASALSARAYIRQKSPLVVKQHNAEK